ncbi:MAG: CoA-binding protein [Sulfurovum sp.]|nr:CoA-binding protein [Sulfurovum sp.]
MCSHQFECFSYCCHRRYTYKLLFWGQQGISQHTAAKRAKNKGMKVVQNLCAMIECHHM